MNIRSYMLRLLLVFVCLFVLFSHSLTVYASSTEDEISSFMGTDVSLSYYTGISTFYYSEELGYNYVIWYDTPDGSVEYFPYDGEVIDTYDPSILNENGYLDFRYRIDFPETISKNAVFDINICISKVRGQISFNGIYGMDSNYNTYNLNYGDYIKRNEGEDRMYLSVSDVSCSDSSLMSIFFCLEYQGRSDGTMAPNFTTDLVAVDVSEVSQNGLLGNISSTLKNIFTGITELPQNIANSISGFFDNVVNAVVNLGTSILDGIKNLFVPSEEHITEMKDKFETLLADRFGALYQVIDLVIDYADAFKSSEKKTITFPTVSIPLGEANFDFGGWEVQIIPDGFDTLISALKMLISIVCTVLFVNGMRSRFEKLVGGSDDI